MYLQEFEDKDTLRNIIIQELRKNGIKFSDKKNYFHSKSTQSKNVRIFKTPLQLLDVDTISLNAKSYIKIPHFVHRACEIVSTDLKVEGLFRKAGSSARQREMKEIIDRGGKWEEKYPIIDVANILKIFFRELPEPLLPVYFHDIFLHCLRLKEKSLDNMLLLCLLLPEAHLDTLMYFMQFVKKVSNYESVNKMSANNLSIVLTPNIMPYEKRGVHSTDRLQYHIKIIEILIENANRIGIVPPIIIEKINTDDSLHEVADDDKKKRRKRRSGSLTRMFNGLKKIVSGKTSPSDENEQAHFSQATDVATPCITKSAKKRKRPETAGFSTKKKREMLQLLPQNSALVSTPFTPNQKCIMSFDTPLCAPQKPSESKHQTQNPKTKHKDGSNSETAFKRLERRWSVVSNASVWGKKKQQRQNCDNMEIDVENSLNTINSQNTDVEFIKIPKTEYEEIKNRVLAIENRLSEEFNILSQKRDSLSLTDEVQTEYEKTLEEVECLSNNSTEKLAKRLSQELKIRRSSGNKIIRSPSARKIGTIRRKSLENENKQNSRLTRRISMYLKNDLMNNSKIETPKSVLKRGRPNTVQTGLPQFKSGEKNERQSLTNADCIKNNWLSSEDVQNKTNEKNIHLLINNVNKYGRRSLNDAERIESTNQKDWLNSVNVGNVKVKTNDKNTHLLTRASNKYERRSLNDVERIHSTNQKDWLSSEDIKIKNGLMYENLQNKMEWVNAATFLASRSPHLSINHRPSLTKLRTANAGMVLAKAKLFDEKNDTKIPVLNKKLSRSPKYVSQINYKPKLVRQDNVSLNDTPKSNRNKTYRTNKENVVRKEKYGHLNRATPLKDHNRIDSTPKIMTPLVTPRTTSQIRKTLAKSPRKVTYSPQNEKKVKTPIKAVHGLSQYSNGKVPRRQSPRLQLLKARHLSSAC